MTIYEEYAKAKREITVWQAKLKELEPTLLRELGNVEEPLRTEYGTFTTQTRTSWTFTTEVSAQEAVFKKQIEAIKKAEIEAGRAEKEETVGVRFIGAKESK